MTRYLIYSHDTYGLGHFRRSSTIAGALVAAHDEHEVLLVTGSPRAESFRLPQRVDTVKIPSVTKAADGSYEPRHLGGGIDRLAAMRGQLVASAVAAYDPDVVVVDHAPVGMHGELWPMLDMIETAPRRPRLVLGLRDIVDDADRVDENWTRTGIWSALDRYDDVVVYGDPRVLTTATELALADRVRGRVRHVGYVAPTMPERMSDQPFLLVTAGGGGDGQRMLRRVCRAVEAGATAGMRCVIVTGPLLSAGRRAELITWAADRADVELMEFSDRMRSLIASASGVISMAGYNTVVEVLAADRPALLVPRRRPRLEQAIRARRLEASTGLSHCTLRDLTPARVSDFVRQITHGRMPRHQLCLDGAARTAALLTRSAPPESSTDPLPTRCPIHV